MIDGPSKDRGERGNAAFESMRKRFAVLSPILDERAQRWWAASEAWAYGFGGVVLVHEATGMAVSTIRAGLSEIAGGAAPQSEGDRSRIRRRGAGGSVRSRSSPGWRLHWRDSLIPRHVGIPCRRYGGHRRVGSAWRSS